MWVSLEVVWAWNSVIRPKIAESARNKLGYFLAVDSRYSSNAGTTVRHTSHTHSQQICCSIAWLTCSGLGKLYYLTSWGWEQPQTSSFAVNDNECLQCTRVFLPYLMLESRFLKYLQITTLFFEGSLFVASGICARNTHAPDIPASRARHSLYTPTSFPANGTTA